MADVRLAIGIGDGGRDVEFGAPAHGTAVLVMTDASFESFELPTRIVALALTFGRSGLSRPLTFAS